MAQSVNKEQQRRIEAARAVVYDENGELITDDELQEALQEQGVEVTENEDSTFNYDSVPAMLSIRACSLAVDTRQDPAEVIFH